MSQFLRELVEKMDEYGQLEHEHEFKTTRDRGGSVDVSIHFADEEFVSDGMVEIAEVGEFLGHQMVEIRFPMADPPVSPIVINAVPKAVVAVLLEE